MNSINLLVENQQFLDIEAGHDWLNDTMRSLHRLQNDPNDKWILYEPDFYSFSILFVALLASGKTLELPQNGQPGHLAWLAKGGGQLISANWLAHADSVKEQPFAQPLQVCPDAPLYFYTSGSSGEPKKIAKTFSQLVTEVEALEKVFPFSENVVFAATVSHQHIYGLLFKLLWPLLTGRKILTEFFEYPEHLARSIQKNVTHDTVLIASPAHLHRLVQDNVLSGIAKKLSCVFSSGGPLNVEVNLRLQQQLGVKLIEVFGSSETGGIAWRNIQKASQLSWQLFPDIEARLSENGNLCINSPYMNNQWYETEDVVELIDEERFTLKGRSDRVVKIEEKRVSLDEIQQKLKCQSSVNDAYVLVVSGNRQQVAAVVELSEHGENQLTVLGKFKFDRQLKQALGEWFEAVVLPKKFRYVRAIPVNSQGKIIKSEMEALFE